MEQQTYSQIVLASGSPRRREFLQQLQLDFIVCTAELDESALPGELPHALSLRLAETKAQVVATKVNDPTQRLLVVAADTVVAIDNQSLGKPVDVAEASAMLRILCGRVHQVITAVSVLDTHSQRQLTRVNTTDVLMRHYSVSELAAYVASDDPFDKAGGYAIQHKEFAPVASINGCISSVIGLPLSDLTSLLTQFGVTVECQLSPICEQHTTFRCCHKTPDSHT